MSENGSEVWTPGVDPEGEDYTEVAEFDDGEWIKIGRHRSPRAYYQVVTQPSVKALVREVQSLMRSGWRPTGGVTLVVEANDLLPYTYLQAMVRPDTKATRAAMEKVVTRAVREAVHGQE